MENLINLGGADLVIKAAGVDESLEKVNELIQKLNEAKFLINELASMNVDIIAFENLD